MRLQQGRLYQWQIVTDGPPLCETSGGSSSLRSIKFWSIWNRLWNFYQKDSIIDYIVMTAYFGLIKYLGLWIIDYVLYLLIGST